MKLKSIRTKLTISSAIVIAMMILLIEVCIYIVAVQQQIKDSGQLYSELVDATGKSFDDLHLSFKRGIDFITKNEELQTYLLMEYQDVDERRELNVHLRRLLTDRALLMNEIDALYLYDAGGELRTFWKKKNRSDEVYLPYPEIESEWFVPSGRVSGQMIKGKLVFTRLIRSINNLSNIGYLLAVYDEDELYARMESALSNAASSLVVFDANGEIIVHNFKDEKKLDQVLLEVNFRELSDYQVIQLKESGKCIVSQYVSQDTGWRITSIAEVKYITRSANFIRNLVFVLGAAGIFSGILIQWMLAHKIVGPLKHMVTIVEGAKEGDYKQRMELQTEDELSILADSFNHMLEQTDILVNQVLRDELKYKEMQLSLMQAQINPHMLYNTLECINWLAEFDRKDEIRQVTIAFSNLMKSLSNGKKIVGIEEELEYSNAFLLIYQILLDNKLSYQLDVDEDLKQIRIPRLTIQPLVENSVLHGIKKSLCGGKIYVSIFPTKGGILISVLDDGVGMDMEQVKKINDYAKKPELDKDNLEIGMGIKNVVDRLTLFYGGKADIHISSEVGWGTTVDVFIPEDGVV